MLDPRERQLLLECLRPPAGYKLDRAVGTSFSLDLLALLTAPLAFTFFDWEDGDGRPTADPLALLQAVRSHAGRIHLFCQGGQIKVPPPGQRLLAWLEPCVIQVTAPRAGGVFHPKIWVLRYVGADGPVRYRLLCSSRNLTFDRSWDCMLAMDGELTDRQRAIAVNHPLGDFIAALPDLALRPLAAAVRSSILAIAEEVRRVRFEPPEGVDEFAFHPLGLAGASGLRLGGAGRPLLVASPFLSDGYLRDTLQGREHCVVISRPEELAKVSPDVLTGVQQVYAMDPAAEDVGDDERPAEAALAGLHAKIMIEDDGWDARVFVGSANATTAAHHRNVEFVTELRGKKSRYGIAAFLDGGGRGGSFRELLAQWYPEPASTTPDVAVRQALQERLDDLRKSVAWQALSLAVDVRDDDLLSLNLNAASGFALPADVSAVCWPVTLPREQAAKLTPGPDPVAAFGPMTVDVISAFLAVELSVAEGEVRESVRFALVVPIEGAPEDRHARLLAGLLRDKERLLRLLWLLLQGDEAQAVGAFTGAENGLESAGVRVDQEFPVFEQMLRALARQPERLREVGRIVEELACTTQGAEVLPPGLVDLWRAVDACLKEGA